MENIILNLLLLFAYGANAQSIIDAQKELLNTIPIGENLGNAFYKVNEEGFFSLGSPIIDNTGNIIFLNNLHEEKYFYVIRAKLVEFFPYSGNLSYFRLINNRHFDSQQGIQVDITPLLYSEKRIIEYDYNAKGIELKGGYYIFYVTPFGGIYYSSKEKSGIAYAFDIVDPSEKFQVINSDQLQSWLITQSGGFSIEDDGFLYRNGMMWSVVLPKNQDKASVYMGRLASGHTVWTDTLINHAGHMVIATPQGTTEIIIRIPWGKSEERDDPGFYDWGLGPGALGRSILPYPSKEHVDLKRK